MMTSHPGLVSFPPSVAPPSAAAPTSRLFHFDSSATITLDFLDRHSPGITRYRYRMELDGEGQGSKVRKVKDEFERRLMNQEQAKPKYKKPFAKARQGQSSRNSSSQEENFGRKVDGNVKFPERGKALSSGLVDAGENRRPETEKEKKDSFARDVLAEISLLRSPNLLLRRGNSKEETGTAKTAQQHPRSRNYDGGDGGGGGDTDATERDKNGSNRSVASETDSVLSNSMIDEVWAMDGVPLDTICKELLRSPVPSSSEMDELVAQNRNRFRDMKHEVNSPEINAVDAAAKRMPPATLKKKVGLSKLKTTNRTQSTDARCEFVVPVNSDSGMSRVSAEQRSEIGSIDENDEMTTKRPSGGASNECRSFAVIDYTKTGLKTNGYDPTTTIDYDQNKQSRYFQGLQQYPSGTEISEEQNNAQRYHKNVPDTATGGSNKELATKTSPCPGSDKRNSQLTSQRTTVTPSLSVDSDGKAFPIGDGCDDVFDIDCISLPNCSSPPADEIERSRLRLSSPTHHLKTSTSNAESHQASPASQHGSRNAVAANGASSVKVDGTTQGQGQGQEPRVKRRVDKTNGACEDQSGNLRREKEGTKKRDSRVESSQRSRSSDRTLRRSWIHVAKTVEIQLPRRSRSTSKTRKKSLNKEYDVFTVTTTTEETRTMPKLSPTTVGSASPGRGTDEGGAKREADSHVTEKKFEIPEMRAVAESVVRENSPISGGVNKDERQRLERLQKSSVEKITEPNEELSRHARKPEEQNNAKTTVRFHLQNNNDACDEGLRVKVIEQRRRSLEIQPNSAARVEKMSVNDTAKLHFQISELLEAENPSDHSGVSFQRRSTTAKSSTQARDEANELYNRVNELESQTKGLAEELMAFGNIDSKKTDALFTYDEPPTGNSASFDDSGDIRSLDGPNEVVRTSQNTEYVSSERRLSDATTIIRKDDQRFSCTLLVSAIHTLDLPSQRGDGVFADKVDSSRNVSDIQTGRENTNKVSIATKSREYRITSIDESQKIKSENETENSCEYNDLINSTSSGGRTNKETHAVGDRDRYNRPAETIEIRRHQTGGIQDTTKKVETEAVNPATGNFAKKAVEFREKEEQKRSLKTSVDFSDDVCCEAIGEDQQRSAEENRFHCTFIVSAEHRFDSYAKNTVKANFITTNTSHLTSKDVGSQAGMSPCDYPKDTVSYDDIDAQLSRHGVLLEAPVADAGCLRNDVFVTEDVDSPEYEQEITRFVSEAINTACRKTMLVVLSHNERSSRSEEDSIGNRANHTSSSKFSDSIFIPAVARCPNVETAADIRVTGAGPVSCARITDDVNPGEMKMEEVRHKCISETFIDISAASSVGASETAAAAAAAAAEAEAEISLASQAENASDESVNFRTLARHTSSGQYSHFFKSIFRENSADGSHRHSPDIPTSYAAKDSGYDDVFIDAQTQRTDAHEEEEEEKELDASGVVLSVETLSLNSAYGVTACDSSVESNGSKSETVFPENKRSTASLTFAKTAEVNNKRLVSQISTNTEEEGRAENRVCDRGPCTSSSSVSYHMIVPIARTDEAQSRREQITAELGRTNPEQTYTTVLSKRVPVAKSTVYFIGREETEKSSVLEIPKDKIVTVNINSVLGHDVGISYANGGKQTTEISTCVMTSTNVNKGEIDSCAGDSLVPSNDSETRSDELEEITVETIEDSFASNDNSMTDFSALETYCGADTSFGSIEEDSLERSNEVIQMYGQDSAEIQTTQSSDFAGSIDDNVQKNLDMLDFELGETIESAADVECKSSPATIDIIWSETIDSNRKVFYDENEATELSEGHNFDEESDQISNGTNCDVTFRYATELTDTFEENYDEKSYCKVTSFGDDVVTTETQITVMSDPVIVANDRKLTEIARHSQAGHQQVITDDQLVLAMEIHDVDGVEEKLDNSNISIQDELDETVKSWRCTDQLEARNSQEMHSEEGNTTIKSDDDFKAMDLCTETDLETLPYVQDGNQSIEELFTFEISEDDRDNVVIQEEREGFDTRYFTDENLTCDVDNVYADEFYETKSEYLSDQRRRDTDEFDERNQAGGGGGGSEEHEELFSISWTVESKTETDSSKEKNDREPNSGSDWETEETGFTETKWQTIQYGFDSNATECDERGANETAATANREEEDDDDDGDDRKSDDYMVTYEYGEMYSVFREVPNSIEGLRNTVLYNFNNSPSMKRLLTRFPSLRPGTWKFTSAVPEMEPDVRSTAAEVRIVEHLDAVSTATHFLPDLPNEEFFTL